MISTRLFRKLAACIAMLGMLFTQFAVSAYACPAFGQAGQARDAKVMPRAEAAMDALDAQPCNQPAEVQAGLCKAHCEDGQKNVSGAHVLADFVPALVITRPIEDFGQQAQQNVTTADTLPAPSPPAYLRHCVFRI